MKKAVGRWVIEEGKAFLIASRGVLEVCVVQLELRLSVSAFVEESGLWRKEQGGVKEKTIATRNWGTGLN